MPLVCHGDGKLMRVEMSEGMHRNWLHPQEPKAEVLQFMFMIIAEASENCCQSCSSACPETSIQLHSKLLLPSCSSYQLRPWSSRPCTTKNISLQLQVWSCKRRLRHTEIFWVTPCDNDSCFQFPRMRDENPIFIFVDGMAFMPGRHSFSYNINYLSISHSIILYCISSFIIKQLLFINKFYCGAACAGKNR